MTTTAPQHLAAPRSKAARGGNFELNSWLFMRGSGLLLVVLVFGHLFVNLMLGEGIHQIDFAFVAGKWANPFWQVWDLVMLWLAMLHGCNGLRTIINDYADQAEHPLRAQDAALLRHRRRHRARHAGDLHLRPVHRPEAPRSTSARMK